MDFTNVRVEGSNPEVLTWPITARITEFWLRRGGLHVRLEKQNPWPPVDIEGKVNSTDDDQEATLWVFVKAGDQWIATGAERLRPAQTASADKPFGDSPSNAIGVSWLYAADRWPDLVGWKPKDGEIIGIMVAAGSTRSDFNVKVRERSKVITATYRVATDSYEALDYAYNPAPAEAPATPTQPPTQEASVPVSLFGDLLVGIQTIKATESAILQALSGLAAEQKRQGERMEAIRTELITAAKTLAPTPAAAAGILGRIFGR